MIELLPSPWATDFEDLLSSCRESFVLCSPYISAGPCERLARTLGPRTDLSIFVLTDLSPENMLTGSTDPGAILSVLDAVPGATVRYLPRLHAKVYVADSDRAVVTSGNLTDGGLSRNHEYGVRLTDGELVSRIRNHVLGLGDLGCRIEHEELRTWTKAVAELRAAHRTAEKSRRAAAVREFEDRLADVNRQVLQARVGGLGITPTFMETVLFLLRDGPMRTEDIHQEVKRLHPDLCDDTVYRVINNQRFGRKWKHAVRTAQSHLKKQGRIVLREGIWHRVS